jgi:carboxymethylenebutenolidase
MAMTTSLTQIATADGPCTTEIVIPEGKGPWPAVIVFFDAAGLRAAQTRIAQRIASFGYLVFQPDLFHRSPPLTTLVPPPVTLGAMRERVFQDPVRRATFMNEFYAPALTYEHLETTIGAVLAQVESHLRFRGLIGTTGYCMGGNASMRVATIFGKRIAATAAIHPGGLVTDQPDSPHLRAATITSRVYLAPASGDLPPEAESKLRAGLDAGRVRYEIEHYDAKHGYAVEDADSYDLRAADRHYAALKQLYSATLPI